MGDVYWGVHAPLAACAARTGIRLAVETGSFYGTGALQLAALFPRVISIECSEDLYNHCNAHYSQISSLEFVMGDSPSELRRICQSLDQPVFFFLDAHWFPSAKVSQSRRSTDCPLMDELSAIADSGLLAKGSMIVIDDADMFVGGLPGNLFNLPQFPSIALVLRTLTEIMHAEYTDVVDDVIVAGPASLRPLVSSYLQLKERFGAPAAKRIAAN